ncbi:hypothetical protein LCGC14_0609090 [marine sediment metagenome]|uniref:Uncharacterized protein n=1 Tax=marine sediment metagenome TaxID=412755 RepID=A0A0F9TUL8_9ZZZZ
MDRQFHYRTFYDDEFRLGAKRAWQKLEYHIEELSEYLNDVRYTIVHECSNCNKIKVLLHYIV